MALSLGRWWCPLSAGGAGCRGFCCPFVVCSVLLSALLLCLWYIMLEYGSISRFKGVFSGFYGADVYLYGLRVLRGLWGFCVRE